MSALDFTPPPSVDPPTDPLDVLRALPRATQLLLRDYIAGLEAQAGSARAMAEHHERERRREVDLLRMKLSGVKAERDAALSARDAALRSVTELTDRCRLLEAAGERPRRR